jgi:hypothetical protein
VWPGAEQVCDGLNNDCDDASWPDLGGTNEVDADGDGLSVCAGDCDEGDATVFAGAVEINDGIDNQCPGDPGHGSVDETAGTSGFFDPDDVHVYGWEGQPGATSYEVARSTTPHFAAGCVVVTTTATSWVDGESPEAGAVFFYLNRALTPFTGSWGQDSAGVDRGALCGS